MSNKNATKEFLSVPTREMLVKQLQEAGIVTDDLSDLDIIEKLSSYAEEINSKKLKRDADILKDRMNFYAKDCDLTNKEFIDRLYHMSVPPHYLVLFKDSDYNLKNNRIWEIIRASKIPPILKKENMFR